jgi:hypothetical protein
METELLHVLTHVKKVASSAPASDIESFLTETWSYYANELAPDFKAVQASIGLARQGPSGATNISIGGSVGSLHSDLAMKAGTFARDSEILDAAAYGLGLGADRSIWDLVRPVPHRQTGDLAWLDELYGAAETFAAVLHGGSAGDFRDLLRRTFALEYICYHSLALCLVISGLFNAQRP